MGKRFEKETALAAELSALEVAAVACELRRRELAMMVRIFAHKRLLAYEQRHIRSGETRHG
jgi:hypothetical protein